MDTATEIYANRANHPYLRVPQFVIERAVRGLNKLEALALIRGAYQDDEGAWASLADARIIYACILKERKPDPLACPANQPAGGP